MPPSYTMYGYEGPRRSRTNTPKRHNRKQRDHPSPPELTDTSEDSAPSPTKRGGFFRNRTTSPVRNRRFNGRQPDSPLNPVELSSSKRGKRTVTTIKRTKKARSELPHASPKVTGPDESRYHRSLSPSRGVRAGYSPEPGLPMTSNIGESEHNEVHPPPVLFKPKRHKNRTGNCKNRSRDSAEAEHATFQTFSDDYRVDDDRVRSANTSQSNVHRPPKMDSEDDLSEASSSIFADLVEKEEDSTIWGDLEDSDKGKVRKHYERRQRRLTAAATTDEPKQCGGIPSQPIRAQSFPHPRRGPIYDDIESTGGGISAGGADYFADPLSICVLLQDFVAHDCASFFKY